MEGAYLNDTPLISLNDAVFALVMFDSKRMYISSLEFISGNLQQVLDTAEERLETLMSRSRQSELPGFRKKLADIDDRKATMKRVRLALLNETGLAVDRVGASELLARPYDPLLYTERVLSFAKTHFGIEIADYEYPSLEPLLPAADTHATSKGATKTLPKAAQEDWRPDEEKQGPPTTNWADVELEGIELAQRVLADQVRQLLVAVDPSWRPSKRAVEGTSNRFLLPTGLNARAIAQHIAEIGTGSKDTDDAKTARDNVADVEPLVMGTGTETTRTKKALRGYYRTIDWMRQALEKRRLSNVEHTSAGQATHPTQAAPSGPTRPLALVNDAQLEECLRLAAAERLPNP